MYIMFSIYYGFVVFTFATIRLKITHSSQLGLE